MKEVTRVINAQITIIEKMADCENFKDAKETAEAIKKKLRADDVVINSLQDFVLEE